MRKRAAWGVALLALSVPVAASAQSTSGMLPAGGRIFLSVNGLGQAGDGEVLDQIETMPVYGETATLRASQGVALTAGVFDFGGGFRSDRFGLGLAFTASRNSNTGVAHASIPHPFLFNRPRTLSSNIEGLEHEQRAVHLQAYYFRPILDRAEIGLFIGPSFYRIEQDYVTGLGSFSESAGFDTISVSLGRATVSDSQIGYNLGAEATYRFTPTVGAALLLRFTRASAELDLGTSPVTMNVGDVQFGAGLRLRF